MRDHRSCLETPPRLPEEGRPRLVLRGDAVHCSLLVTALSLVAFSSWSGVPSTVPAHEPTVASPAYREDPPAPQEPEPQGAEDDLLAGDDLLGDDDLLLGDDLLLEGDEYASDQDDEAAELGETAYDQHQRLLLEDRYPSASTCATCHPRHYREWSVSQHAYAQLSPLMMAMQNSLNLSMSTTVGDFCLRCHSPVGAELYEPFSTSNLDRHPASREGITCITCHRIAEPYGKVSGRIAVEEGDIFDPVYGPAGGAELERVLENRDTYRVVTDPGEPGRAIHTEARRFFALTTPGFCGSCHDVTGVNGFRLEEAFSDYKHSPAAARGVTCQSCHMGKEEGKPSGFHEGPAAVVGGVETSPRKLTSHYFAGPDSPIVHPGIFPHNVRAASFKTMREWLQFDHEAGWGTDAFEDTAPEGYEFPEAWQSIDDRYDGREIITEQLELLAWARGRRLQVMRNALELGEIEIRRASAEKGIIFEVEVSSATDGHNVPTGFDAERLIFLEVEVRDESGRLVYASGDRDPNGDVRDLHSVYVHAGKVPLDRDLFSLQSKFIIRLNRGGEQEQVLPLNQSVSALPFNRPETRPTILYGRPKGARKHRQGIEPGGSRTATYKVRGSQVEPGTYSIDVRLRYQAVPINLVHAIQAVGFDFNMSPRQVADAVIAGGEVIAERSASVTLGDGTGSGSTRTAQSSVEAGSEPRGTGVQSAEGDALRTTGR